MHIASVFGEFCTAGIGFGKRSCIGKHAFVFIDTTGHVGDIINAEKSYKKRDA